MPDVIKIQMVLDKVQIFLAKWLDCHLKGLYKVNFWQSAVLNALTAEQRINVEENGAGSLDDLDFATLVAVFLGNFKTLRKELHLDLELSDMAKHVKKIRNLYAHKNSKAIKNPNLKKVKYHFETLHQFMDGLGAEVDLLREIDELNISSVDSKLRANSALPSTVVASNGVKISVSSVPRASNFPIVMTEKNENECISQENTVPVNDMNKMVISEQRRMQLPKWLDEMIFGELNAKYNPSCCDITVIDWNKTEIKNYLGTYFPRSYVESFCLYAQWFKSNFEVYKTRKNLSVFDFGCGTGGEILGFLDAVGKCLPAIESVKVRALDGNQHALRNLERIVERRRSTSKLVVSLKTIPVTIDDFYDLGVVRSVIDDMFDFFMTWKSICEFVTKQQFEEYNPYTNIIQVFSDILVPDGRMLIIDVSTKNSTTQEWLPNMLDEGIKESGVVILDRNSGFNETFVVKHSHFACDQSKIAWRFIEPIKGDNV